ncbi:MAG: hypothetical protein A2096_17825 [Spirochaetes bacterium GWF1_41_5]|nr:MAG: hypothetical protein A2096_17825 [Spirochaetes bacterium GWF1_41_5]
MYNCISCSRLKIFPAGVIFFQKYWLKTPGVFRKSIFHVQEQYRHFFLLFFNNRYGIFLFVLKGSI